MEYYIFGAHPRGWTLYQYLMTLEPKYQIIGFLYDNEEENPEEIDGVKVIKLSAETKDFNSIKLSATVYVATRGIYHEKIIRHLTQLGFIDIIPVTPQLDTELRNRYVSLQFELSGREFVKFDCHSLDNGMEDDKRKGDDRKNEVSTSGYYVGGANIYIAKTAFDSDFSNLVPLKSYESIIQAGSIYTDIKLPEASYYDDIDENISNRNSQFCELTVLYWIWKHAKEDIIGLEHWRRRFLLPNRWKETMTTNGIDVILPVPLCVMPSLEQNYKGRHISEIWDKCMAILKELYPDDYDNAVSFFRNNNLYSPCNMIIAKKKILCKYCEWLFPVLFKLNDEVGVIEDKYQNRYPGFLAERLLNYFFEKNRDRYKIVYADKSFLS